MNSNKKEASRVIAVLGLAGIFITALAITPFAIASTSGAVNQIEVIRAQTHYKPATGLVVDPPVASSSSAGLSPDMQLVREAATQGGSQGTLLLQAAGDS